MGLKGDDAALYLSGSQILLKECGIFIEQPRVKQIIQNGEKSFFTALSLLTEMEDAVNELREQEPRLASYPDFQVLMLVLFQNKSVKKAVENFFNLICPAYSCEVTETSINFKKVEDNSPAGVISPANYERAFQILKDVFLMRGDENDELNYNPANEQAKEIAEKLMEGRRKASEIKNGDNSLFATYASVLSIGLQQDINIFFNYTPFQLYDAVNRYFLKVQYDFYQKVSTTPLMDTSNMDKPDDWRGNLYK